jgi:hypothetical protein
MSSELLVMRGTVIGDANTPVAGWVSLGKRSPQRWISRTVRITTEDGRKITLEDLTADTIAPVVTEEKRWRDLEGGELARLCSREAPAPDVEVELTTAVLRGGEAIVAWGVATEHGPAGGGGGDAYRGTAERVVTRLSARAIATGDDREALLERARARFDDEARAAARAAREAPAPAAKAGAKPKDPDSSNRLAWNLPLWLALGGLAVVAAFALAGTPHGPWLRIAAMLALAPIALDAALVPRFRDGASAPPPLDVPITGFLLAAAGVALTSVGVATGDVAPDRAKAVHIASIVLAAIALIAFAWLWSATRARRRTVAMMIGAPPQPQPPRDGVWGALDGAFSSEVMSVGEDVHVHGAAVKDAAGIKRRSVSTTGFAKVAAEGTLRAAGATHRVRLAEAAILTMAKLERSTGKDRGMRADVINERTPVRVVGRATEGVFAKGGEASLLVFAAAVDTDVATELRRLHLRHRVANALAVAGVLALAASFAV